MTQVIDAHAHFFTAADLDRVAGGLPYSLPSPHPLTEYLDTLIDTGVTPGLINNVHLSILPDSENVFASFKELAALKTKNPARYGGIEIVGTILAKPDYATAERLAHPQVKGVRIVLHDATPDQVGDQAYASAAWHEMYSRLRPDQHLHIYAQNPEVNLKVLRQIPHSLRIAIDHLGTCQPERGPDDATYVALLLEAKSRGNVIFKGPGYRTSTTPEAVAPFVVRIAETLGADKLILQASDAPHVGKDQSGRPYADLFTPVTVFDFVSRLSDLTAANTNLSAKALLRGASAEIFTPHQ